MEGDGSGREVMTGGLYADDDEFADGEPRKRWKAGRAHAVAKGTNVRAALL
jgi:hypothetical protein